MANKLEKKGENILKEQFYGREYISRNDTKSQYGRSTNYNTISSSNSLKQHTKQWRMFAKFVFEQYGVKTLKKIELNMVVAFLQRELSDGLSEKTIKARITAINHVMVGTGVWKENQKLSLSKLRKDGFISKVKGATRVYKKLTSEEWRERNQNQYVFNQEVIDFTRAFGLRKSEIYGNHGQYKGVTFRNFGHVEGSQNLLVEVIGKGGKYRIATVREDFSEKMWEKYGHICRTYPKDYFQKTDEEREKILKASSKAKERIFQIPPRAIPLHINRSEYVQKLLQEKQDKWEKYYKKITAQDFKDKKVGYTRIQFNKQENGKFFLYKTVYKKGEKIVSVVDPFSIIQIGTWRGYAVAAVEVSNNVGHNRLDVLRKYMI